MRFKLEPNRLTGITAQVYLPVLPGFGGRVVFEEDHSHFTLRRVKGNDPDAEGHPIAGWFALLGVVVPDRVGEP